MMGSAAQREIATLESVLLVITQPELVAKNIETLKTKLIEVQDATRLAREEQDKVTASIKDLKAREDTLKPREEVIKQKEDNFEANKKALADEYERHAEEVEALQKAKVDHENVVKEHNKNASALTSHVAVQAQKVKDDNAKFDKQASALKAREDSVTVREEKVAEAEARMREKADKLRQLAE